MRIQCGEREHLPRRHFPGSGSMGMGNVGHRDIGDFRCDRNQLFRDFQYKDNTSAREEKPRLTLGFEQIWRSQDIEIMSATKDMCMKRK